MLSIDNGVPHSGMLLYLHHRNSKLFFHPAKFDNFKDETISDFKTVTKQKLAGLKTGGLVGLYEQLLRGVFYVLGGKKIFDHFFLNILASALKSCIK